MTSTARSIKPSSRSTPNETAIRGTTSTWLLSWPQSQPHNPLVTTSSTRLRSAKRDPTRGSSAEEITMAILSGTLGNDTLTGGDLADVILGRDGDDSIVGAGENDFLSGGAGDDNINTGFGDDVVEGGMGNDTVGGLTGRDVVHAGKGDDFIAWNDPVGDVVFGNQGNDVILGGDIAADVIDGGAGDDFIRAFATSANAATASDTLIGGRGNDILIGGDAADYIEGGRDNDILSGNDGADVFVFVAAEPGNDVSTDFNRQEEVVRLEGFEAGFDPLSNLTATASGTLLDL